MGVLVVGDRLMFKHHLKELHRKHRYNRRLEGLWEGREQVFFNETEQQILVSANQRHFCQARRVYLTKALLPDMLGNVPSGS